MYENEPIAFSRRSPAEALVDNIPNFRTMEVGHSFFVPDNAPDADGKVRNSPLPVSAACSVLYPKQFKVRDEVHPTTGVSGRRVYRVADATPAGETTI